VDLHPGQQNCLPHLKPSELDPVRHAFHENTDWYRDLIEHSHDLLCLHDLEGQLLLVNQASARALGYDLQEILRIPMRELIAPEYRDQFNAYLSKIEREGEARGLLVVMTRAGERRIWEYSNALRSGGPGKPVVSGIARDVTEQKRAEKLARETAELNRQIIASAGEGIVVYDRSLRCVVWNPYLEKMTGIAAEAAIGKTFRELIPSDVHSVDPEVELKRALLGHTITVPDEELPTKSGMRWVSSRKGPLRDAQGEITGVIVTVQDVTERKRAEEALRASEDRYRALYESSPVGVCWVETRTGRFLGVNPKYCEITGRSEQDLLSRDFLSITHPNDLARSLEKRDQLLNGEMQHYQMGKRYLRPDGSERWVELNAVAICDEGEKPVWHMAIVQDITDRKEAQENLRRSEERFRILVEQAPDGIFVTDPTGRFLDVNSAGAKMLGYSTKEILQLSVADVVASEEIPRILPEVSRVEAGNVTRTEWNVRRKDGSCFQGEVVSSRLSDGRIQGILRDVSERDQAEESLRVREENYRLFVAQSSEGIFREEMDPPVATGLPEDELIHRILHDSYIGECNDALARMYGLERGEELVGKHLGEMVRPENPHHIVIARDYIRSGFRLLEREFHEVDVQGNPKVFLHSMIGTIENGRLVRTWGIQRDITEKASLEEARRQAQEALRQSEERERARATELQTILDTLPIPVLIARDPDCSRIDANRAGAGYLRVPEGSNVSLSAMAGQKTPFHFERDGSVIPPEQLPLQRTVKTKAPIQDPPTKLVFADGTEKYELGNAAPLFDEDGKLRGAVAAAIDITEQIQAERALRESEERFRVAISGSPIKVFNQDRDLRYTWVYNTQDGWSESDYLGKTDEEIFGPEIGARMSAIKRPVLETGRGSRQEFNLTARGKTYYCDLTVEPLLDAAGEITGVNCACIDITHVRQIAEELRLAQEKLAEEKLYLEEAIDTELGFGEIVGRSDVVKGVMQKVARVAPSDATVLLLGETGTGKELLARALHHRSGRDGKSFIKVNCAAIPSGLLESELFGHEKGAFTGAVGRKLGRLELADGGTLFLDEIGEVPLSLQPKLLRALQDMEFERLGGTQTIKVDFRLVAATNRDLLQATRANEFRSDLYYRLNVFPILIPPLRERREDIRPLVEHFVHKFAAKMKKPITSIPSKTMELLVRWEWPGNIRELENFVERSVILSSGSVLQAPLAELETKIGAEDGRLTLRETERETIIRVLRECHGKLGGADGAAARLGLKRTTLQSKLDQLGIKPKAYR
jgi:PAS domain S-box-containing protein